jgi:hypothetical protein
MAKIFDYGFADIVRNGKTIMPFALSSDGNDSCLPINVFELQINNFPAPQPQTS